MDTPMWSIRVAGAADGVSRDRPGRTSRDKTEELDEVAAPAGEEREGTAAQRAATRAAPKRKAGHRLIRLGRSAPGWPSFLFIKGLLFLADRLCSSRDCCDLGAYSPRWSGFRGAWERRRHLFSGALPLDSST
jgi:hypothetical protein